MLESEVEKRTMPDFVKPLADVEVIESKEAVLKCKVTGLPYPTISWYHNSKRIESSEERKMTQRKQRAMFVCVVPFCRGAGAGKIINTCLSFRQGCPQPGDSERLSRSRGRLQGRRVQ